MAMKKYADGEGAAEVFRGEEAIVVNQHLSKTGKSIVDFSDEERSALNKDLDSVQAKAAPTTERDNQKSDKTD